MDPIRAFAALNFEPLLADDNPSVRAYVRDRGFATPSPFEVVDANSSVEGADRLPSDDLLRRQMSFEGRSPIDAEANLAMARDIEQATLEVHALSNRIRAVADGSWLPADVSSQRLLERKSRVARWWRFATRHALMWSAISAGALLVFTALLSRDGSSLDPVVVTGGILALVIALIAGFSAAQRASRTEQESSEHSSALWAQSLTAYELSSLQGPIDELDRRVVETISRSAPTLGAMVNPLQTAHDDLRYAVRVSYWTFRSLTDQAQRDAELGGDSGLTQRASHVVNRLAAQSTDFEPETSTESVALDTSSRVTRTNFSSDRAVAVALSGVFAIVASSAIMGIPSIAIANDKCSYAIAEVRIDDCEDITGLDAAGLNLSEISLANRDVSRSDFTGTNLTKATLTRTDFTFADLTGANLSQVRATSAVFEGVFAQAINMDKADLANADMSGADLSDGIFTEADIVNTEFVGSVISGATFAKANAEGATFVATTAIGSDFSEATLEAASFANADLTGADLSKAVLDNAILANADLTGATLEGASLVGADFTGATLSGVDFAETDFSEAALDLVDLSGLDLSGLDLSGYSLTGANLSNTNLTNTSLENANLEGADLTGATITGLKLSGATLGGVSVKALLDGGANLEGVDLSGADLSGLAGAEVNLPGATLDGVDLTGYDLTGANLQGASLVGADLQGATLTDANFSQSDLSSANLATSEMSEANFAGATLSRADLTDARALDSDFSGASFVATDLLGADFSRSNMTGARGLGSNALAAQWVDATCPNGQTAEICRS